MDYCITIRNYHSIQSISCNGEPQSPQCTLVTQGKIQKLTPEQFDQQDKKLLVILNQLLASEQRVLAPFHRKKRDKKEANLTSLFSPKREENLLIARVRFVFNLIQTKTSPIFLLLTKKPIRSLVPTMTSSIQFFSSSLTNKVKNCFNISYN